MPTEPIVALLIQERDKLNRAIEVLRGEKRRGRPPKSGQVPTASVSLDAPKKNGWTDAQRKKQGERIKAYWAAKRKAKK